MSRSPDVLVVGAGPAGLGTAVACARRGMAVSVLERRDAAPIDKACGEGLMPDAVLRLADWGIHPRGQALRGIRYRDERTTVEGSFPGPAGLGVRRTELSTVLLDGAQRSGVALHLGDEVDGLERDGTRWSVQSSTGRWQARVVVGADGLGSPVRRAAGLERTHRGRRVGMRRHVRGARATQVDVVEVIWGDGVEAYLTPVDGGEMGVALLEDPRRRGQRAERRNPSDRTHGGTHSAFDRAALRVPGLIERLDGLEFTTRLAGSGPLRARAAAPVSGNLALVGDAGGYVDAITGEGLAIAFAEAEALARALGEAPLDERTVHEALRNYAVASRHIRRLPDLITHGALMLAARPGLRRRFLGALARHPARFDRVLALHVRAGSDWEALPVAAGLAWRLVSGS